VDFNVVTGRIQERKPFLHMNLFDIKGFIIENHPDYAIIVMSTFQQQDCLFTKRQEALKS
jgi:hypothetical protein